MSSGYFPAMQKPPPPPLGYGACQLIILSPPVPEPDAKLLISEPFDYHAHVSKMLAFFDEYWSWLNKTGSLILHHNPLPINLPLNHPLEWLPRGRLRFHQFLAWDKETTAEQRHPDWFHGRVDCLWWLVRSEHYKFHKHRANNLLRGTVEQISLELLNRLSDEDDLVASNLDLAKLCIENERRFTIIEL